MEALFPRLLLTSTWKNLILKRHADEIFPGLTRSSFNGFLQHLNSRQPTIHITMEIKKDNTIPFLGTSVTRDSDGFLTSRVYKKPTHTDQYLAYDSHHPQSVIFLSVRSAEQNPLHATKPSVISEEKKHFQETGTCFQ